MVAIRVRSGGMVDLAVGQQWVILIEATELPTLVVTKPDGTTLTPAVVFEEYRDTSVWTRPLPFGQYGYRAVVTPDVAGRWLAVASTVEDGSAGALQAYVAALTASTAMPDADSLDDWLGGADAHSFEQAWLEDEIAAALRAQRARCNIPGTYPEPLREAAHRRAARLLYMRRQLTEQPRTDGDFDTPPVFPPGRDFTVRELETPFYRTPIG